MQKYHDEPKQYKGYLKSALGNAERIRLVHLIGGEHSPADPDHLVGERDYCDLAVTARLDLPQPPAARRSQSCSNGFKRSTPSWSKSRTLRVTTVNRCTKAVAAIMASSSRVSERRCLSRAHSRNVSAFIGSTL